MKMFFAILLGILIIPPALAAYFGGLMSAILAFAITSGLVGGFLTYMAMISPLQLQPINGMLLALSLLCFIVVI